MWLRRLLCCILAASTLGCGAGWHQPPELAPGPWPKRQQAQIWSDEHSRQWHSLIVSRDSISGVPFTRNPNCGDCRQAVALNAVDSVRIGDPEAGFLKTVGLIVALPIAVLIVLCRGECYPET
jgi:hypothetical protein